MTRAKSLLPSDVYKLEKLHTSCWQWEIQFDNSLITYNLCMYYEWENPILWHTQQMDSSIYKCALRIEESWLTTSHYEHEYRYRVPIHISKFEITNYELLVRCDGEYRVNRLYQEETLERNHSNGTWTDSWSSILVI